MHYSIKVNECINYINNNLTQDISLEYLASHFNFSPYYFHRLFNLCMGETPMEYIRRRRLRLAAKDMILHRLSIVEVAGKYKFESQDGFSRAFKRYYGLTPGEFKKLNGREVANKLNLINNAIKKEVKNTLYNFSLYERLICSKEDKIQALRTLDKILYLSENVKKSGLLSLEREMESLQPDFFKKAVEMLIDGFEADCIKELLSNYVLCGNYQGRELLIRILIIEGILSIQEGVHPSILREKLSSFFGDDFIGDINKHFGIDKETQLTRIESFINKNKQDPVLSKDTALLEEPVKRLDNRSLQRLLRDIDLYTLVTAVKGTSGKTQVKIIQNVSRKISIILLEEITKETDWIIDEITESQKLILETINNLNKQGEIII